MKKLRVLFRRVLAFIEKRLTILKSLFVLSMLVFVIFEIGNISRQLNGRQLRASLATQDPGTLLLMLVAGFVAVLPMLNYDFTIVQFLPGEYKKRYIVKSGWIVNTFTNIAGFGGFLGATLRANFYSKQATHKQVVFAISKIALFLLSGLSLLCLVSLGLIFGFNVGSVYGHYWIWLVGGGLYFPLLMLVTHLRDSKFFADLPLRRELRLTIGSSFEWGFCVLFFVFIGYLLKVPVNLPNVVPLFAIASVIGVVSMLPGGLGTFDVFMIIGLGFIGVDRSTAVIWLLFYRLFYYIFPFLVGVFLFIQDAGQRLNTFLQGLPKLVLQKTAHGILVIFLYFSGVMLLILSTVPNFALNNRLFARLYPYTFVFLDQVTNIIMAFLLLGFARGIAAKVQRAYYPTLILLVVAILNTLWRDFSWKMALLLGVILIATIFSKHELYREKMALSWGSTLFDWVLFAGSFIVYTIVGVYNLPQSPHHVHKVPTALFFPSERLWITGFIGMLIAALALLVIYQYLTYSRRQLAAAFDEQRVHQLIKKFGGNEVSHLAYLRDKELYFYQVDGEDQVMFMYQQKANRLIVMGEPVGNPQVLTTAIEKFMDDADSLGFSLVFYEISSELTMQLHEIGYDFIKIGEEGYVRLADFSLSGKKRKAERTLMNKFNREGYQFQLIQPPYTAEQFAKLRRISDSWLDGRHEEGFSLGFFDEYYLNRTPIAVISDKNGQWVAFANLMPMSNGVLSIDLMRHLKSAPSGIMDEVFIHLFQEGQAQDYQSFDLGNAPLANVGVSKYSFIQERLAHLVYEYGYRFYGFQGLCAYKNKYVTQWIPKYIAYSKHSSILFVLLQIMLVVNQKVKAPKHRHLLLIPRFLRVEQRKGPDETLADLRSGLGKHLPRKSRDKTQ
ncbi:bifunctional lysylphosphatidylglycerol flippase/synthetase MprF [Loigolactobacillus backii]|uniref:bifunctional lysylphosphatidylglycerol flippase/synthetase MprF n=1 Tax=Loigolactobacillus backii TaxID=375175 RepID=UPI000839AC5A|nr:bifunctional lysylphosphatidylglycerol flippase/synthetase MprF [Loigolactobacillus backii]